MHVFAFIIAASNNMNHLIRLPSMNSQLTSDKNNCKTFFKNRWLLQLVSGYFYARIATNTNQFFFINFRYVQEHVSDDESCFNEVSKASVNR